MVGDRRSEEREAVGGDHIAVVDRQATVGRRRAAHLRHRARHPCGWERQHVRDPPIPEPLLPDAVPGGVAVVDVGHVSVDRAVDPVTR